MIVSKRHRTVQNLLGKDQLQYWFNITEPTNVCKVYKKMKAIELNY